MVEYGIYWALKTHKRKTKYWETDENEEQYYLVQEIVRRAYVYFPGVLLN